MEAPNRNTHRYNVLNGKWKAVLYGSFFAFFSIALLVGGLGPDALIVRRRPRNHSRISCPHANIGSTADCTTNFRSRLKDMDPLNQLFYTTVQLSRPNTTIDGGGNHVSEIESSIALVLNVTGITDNDTPPPTNTFDSSPRAEPIVRRDNLIRHFRCHEGTVTSHDPADALMCSPFELFALEHLEYPQYDLHVSMKDVLRAFGISTIDPDDDVRLNFEFVHHFVNKAYSRFELGWRYFFVISTLMIAAAFTCQLRSVPKAQWTVEQRWALALLWGLVVFNNPAFAGAIYTRSPFWSGLSVFLVTSYLSILLLWWLSFLDMTRIAGEQGIRNTSRIPLNTCFWIPKIVWMCIFWTSSTAYGIYLVYRLQEDPAWNVWEDDPFRKYAFGVIVFLLIIYDLWALLLLAQGCRQLKHLQGHHTFITTLSICSIVIIVSLLFAGAFTFVPKSSIIFLGSFATVNLYVWWLGIALLPDEAEASFDGMRAREHEEQGIAVGGQLGDSEEEDSDVDVGLFMDRSGVEEHGIGDIGEVEARGRRGRRLAGGDDGAGGSFAIGDEHEEEGDLELGDIGLEERDELPE